MKSGVIAVLLWSLAGAAAAVCQPDAVEMRGPTGRARFSVELAVTPAQREHGLMDRKAMPSAAGMLFLFAPPQKVAFWMKDTLIPLDMIFFDETGMVERIHEHAAPGDLTPIDGGDGIAAVLEINAGLARQLGIAPGWVMRNPALDQSRAAWSCATP